MPRLSKILGPDGRPVKVQDLAGEERARPTLAGVRPAISGHPADGLTPRKLAAIHLAADQGDAIAYAELAEDIEERDAHYRAVLSTRRRQVAQIPITVEAASDDEAHVQHADFIRSWINDGVLGEALFDLLDAIGKGLAIAEIVWSTTPARIEPAEIKWRPLRWFAFDDTDLDTPMLWELGAKVPLERHRFLVHRHKSKSGLSIRGGLARPASWAWMYKAFTARDWAIFVQNYGQPVRVGKYDRSASEAEKDVLWRAVANIAGDCAAIIPADMEIKFEEVKSAASSAEVYEHRADWFDRQVSKLVLGQTTTTDAVSGGHAVAKEHRLVQEDIERADAAELSTTLTRQLVPLLIAFNFGPQPAYPKIVIGRPDELPVKELVEAVARLGPLGLTVEASQVRDRLGMTDPAKTEDVELIGGRVAAGNVDRLAAGEVHPAPRPSPARGEGEEAALQADAHGGGSRSPGMGALRALIALHGAGNPDMLERLAQRLAEDAAGAMAGLTDEVRDVFDAATSLDDLARRLSALKLDPDAFAEAMARGMALAHLIGQAALVDELGRG